MYETLADVVQAIRTAADDERERILDELEAEEFDDGSTALDHLLYDWRAWARPDQLAPVDVRWRFLFLRAGRGGGKTRSGAEFVRECAADPDSCGGKIALIAPTHGDIRITMIEGESGILAVSPPWDMPEWQPGYGHGGRLLWRGAPPAASHRTAAGDTVEALAFSAEKPGRIRGPQFGAAWGDEIAEWGISGLAVHDVLNPALRLGKHPRCMYTSTPKPTPLVEQLANDAEREEQEIAEGKRDPKKRRVIQRVWSTFDNAANLPAATIAELLERYDGTRQGEQELRAALLTRDPDALWSYEIIYPHRRTVAEVPELVRTVIAVDNALEEAKEGTIDPFTIHGRNRDVGPNDTGIVGAGLGSDGHVYVFGDWTINAGPERWGRRAIEAFATAWCGRPANMIVIERNAGGSLIKRNLDVVMRDQKINPALVPMKFVTSKQGKEARAEPVVSLYEQGRVHHVYTPASAPGAVQPLADLEYQQTRFKRGRTGVKKDRVDALVLAITELISGPVESRAARAARRGKAYTR